MHVVHVVLTELEHAMSQCICLLQGLLHIALLGVLVLQPHLFEILLGVFALEQMPEDQLILVDGFLRDDQCQGPLHFIV